MNPKYSPGEKVQLIILRETDLGFVARINGVDEGLLYHTEIFESLKPGLELDGYINKIRPDGLIDLLLQPFGNFGAGEIGERILKVLKDHHGFIPVTDKSSPEKIYELFGVSKKKYKIALGGLYKKRLVAISDDGIRLTVK